MQISCLGIHIRSKSNKLYFTGTSDSAVFSRSNSVKFKLYFIKALVNVSNLYLASVDLLVFVI